MNNSSNLIKKQLKNYLTNITINLFNFSEDMYLKDNNPVDNINNFKQCNNIKSLKECDNNCIIDNNKCKYIITKNIMSYL